MPGEYRIVRFEHHQMAMPAERFFLERSDVSGSSRGEREMRISDMQAIVDRSDSAVKSLDHKLDSLWSKQDSASSYAVASDTVTRLDAIHRASAFVSTTRAAIEGESSRRQAERKTINRFSVEIYKKYAIPFACLLFVLVGCPLGILTRGGNFGLSAAISLGCYVGYWMSLIGGEKLADRDLLDPGLAMWMGNIIFFAIGAYATYKVNNQ
jgi:lipopolysaccharide export system permease protein